VKLDSNGILVTGAAGWLGSRLVEALVHGLPGDPVLEKPVASQGGPATIRCLVLPGADAAALKHLSPSVQVIQGDLREPADCERFAEGMQGALLLHVAGIIHPARVREFYDINLRGTTNLLDAAAHAKVRRAVVMSSNSPCGCNPHPDHLFDELSPYHPYMHYGRSKMQMELAVKERQRFGSMETVIIRAPWFYGPHQPPRQSLFFKMIRDGKAPIVGSGNNLRSMAYVDNLCQGLMLAGTVPEANGRTYWIADRRPYSMNEIIDTIEKLLEQEFGQKCAHKRLRLPSLASSVAYAMDALLQSAGLYHQKIHVLSEMNKTIACSVERAEKELGYNPCISLEEGMRRSIAWWLSGGGQKEQSGAGL
jgi:nucleoside-diphosphate-sugar epimerase